MSQDLHFHHSRGIPKEWLTHFELSKQLESPGYGETMAYFNRLAASSPYAKMFSFGVSPQGRDLHYVVVANGGEFTPQQAHDSWKAVVLVQNGIHAGEIEGKDAWMLMLREMLITSEKQRLLDKVILLIIPILNVDGHERSGPTNRPNQNGPARMGWRTTSQNLNLNRDYMKADAPEMQALLRLYTTWQPDFIIDNHTTNGADYQYHITYGIEHHQNIDPALSGWGAQLMASVLPTVEERGFLTAPYIDVEGDLRDGFSLEPSLPRYSTGYAAAQNRLCLLVETHSLKPFANRVFSTKAMNEAVLDFIHDHAADLKKVNREADSASVRLYSNEREPFPLQIAVTNHSTPFMFKGFEQYEDESPVTGSTIIKYTTTPIEFEVPLHDHAEVVKSVRLPLAYCIPEQFLPLVQKLILHGIEVRTLAGDHECKTERYRFKDALFAPRPYEGRQRVECSVESFEVIERIPHGTYVVPTAQRTVRVLAQLLEPDSPDSMVQWGFFNAFFERKEYAEPYIMEPIAREMLKQNPAMREEFYTKLDEDEEFRNDPSARLEFFYRRSQYHDTHENIYPIRRIVDRDSFDRLISSLS